VPFGGMRKNHVSVVLRPVNVFVASSSNHKRNCLKSHTLRQAQGERILQELLGAPHERVGA